MERALRYTPFYEFLTPTEKIRLLTVNKTFYAWIARPIVWKMPQINFTSSTPFSIRDISLYFGGSKCATCFERASEYGMKHVYFKSTTEVAPLIRSIDVQRMRYLCHVCQRWVCWRCESSMDMKRCCLTCISCDSKNHLYMGYQNRCHFCEDRKAQIEKKRQRKIRNKRKYHDDAVISGHLSSKNTKTLMRSYHVIKRKNKKARHQ